MSNLLQIGDVIRWLDEGAEAEVEVAKRLRATGSEEAARAWEANWNREERQRSSIYTTAETILGAFADPLVLDASSAADYTPAALLDGEANTLYLCAPAHEQERLRIVFAAMISELVSVVYEVSAQTGKPLDPPLLIVLDEAANIAAPADLDGIASSGADDLQQPPRQGLLLGRRRPRHPPVHQPGRRGRRVSPALRDGRGAGPRVGDGGKHLSRPCAGQRRPGSEAG